MGNYGGAFEYGQVGIEFARFMEAQRQRLFSSTVIQQQLTGSDEGRSS